jgi:predicted DNA-binding protein (MmcQ/YjbR family)
MKWIQHFGKPGLNKRDLKTYTRQSHRIVAEGLSGKTQAALGLVAAAQD